MVSYDSKDGFIANLVDSTTYIIILIRAGVCTVLLMHFTSLQTCVKMRRPIILIIRFFKLLRQKRSFVSGQYSGTSTCF